MDTSSYDIQPHQASSSKNSSQSPQFMTNHDAEPSTTRQNNGDSSYVPRPKRIACAVCRRRKLRCDGRKPSCGTCSRLGHECLYEEARKKSGPKRGYVKQLEARLAQVETMLKSQEPGVQENSFSAPLQNEPVDITEIPSLPNHMETSMPPLDGPLGAGAAPSFMSADTDGTSHFGWDMISLGLEEPLPSREVTDDLHRIFFEKVYPALPMIHRPRYMAAMDFAPNIRPPVCLQYTIWCTAASIIDKYSSLHSLFYQRARKYADLDEMKGLGEGVLSLAHCQTWLLISAYEYKMMFFPRAWLSAGKAARLALMLGLHRLDGAALEAKQCLPPPRDWVEKEERRRVFWITFCIDRYASIGTGWPFILDERDISTNLPTFEEAFVKGKPEQTPPLNSILIGEGFQMLSPLGSVSFLSSLFGRNVAHLHRPEPDDNESDLNGIFWQRHRSHDNILLHFALSMPNHLRLPAGMHDPNVVFANMAVHTSTICLHQAAIYKAEKNRMPEQIVIESKRRCIVAAEQISSIMKMVSSMDLTTMNPFLSFCVYVAARVFVQYLKFRPDDMAARSSLQFVFSVLDALKRKNPLTESFLVQLDVDIEGTPFKDIRISSTRSSVSRKDFFYNDTSKDRAHLKPGAICLTSSLMDLARAKELEKDAAQPEVHAGPSLANRTKQTSIRPSNIKPSSMGSTLPYNIGEVDPGGLGAALDVNFPPEFNDTSTSGRDDSTPSSTVNSSSNHSFLRTADNPASPKCARNPSSLNGLMPDPVTSFESPSTFFPVSAPPQVLPATIITPMDSTGSDGAIHPMWNYPAGGNADPNNENIDLMPGGVEQWAQIMSLGSWNS